MRYRGPLADVLCLGMIVARTASRSLATSLLAYYHLYYQGPFNNSHG